MAVSKFPSSVAIPRAGGVRRLRLRAEQGVAELIRVAPTEDGAGHMSVPSREGVSRGEKLQIEISFGPLADEVVLEGLVAGVTPRGDKAPLVDVLIVHESGEQLEYVCAVLAGRREPSARRHRRIDASTACRWSWGLESHEGKLENLSRGGAFVGSDTIPPVGSALEVELALGGRPVRLAATVPWIRKDGERPGFAVNFRITDRQIAEQMDALVRRDEISDPET